MRSLLGVMIIACLFIPPAIINAAGIFYEEISEADGNSIMEESMQRTPTIHKSFHQCSLTENCNYVIKDLANGKFYRYKNKHDLPHNMKGLRIWKKVYHGLFNDCQHAYNSGYKQDGVYNIILPSIGISKVRCDMKTVPKGWIVFQRRVDGTASFYRNWEDYKAGFGDLNGNFWFGLEKLHQLAGPGKRASLRIDLKHMSKPNEMRHSEYSLFEISSESDGYKLTIDGYSGNAGNSLAVHNGMKFTTRDRDLDLYSGENCAVKCPSGFWYNSCHYVNLNGIYPPNISSSDPKYLSWRGMTRSYGGIIFCEMKIRI